jgi:hypothetical protein
MNPLLPFAVSALLLAHPATPRRQSRAIVSPQDLGKGSPENRQMLDKVYDY